MVGRRPTPTALKLLRGNPGQRRIRPEPQPTPLTTADPPSELRAAARRVWCEIAPQAIQIGTLTLIDRPEFILACRLRASGLAGLGRAERRRREPEAITLQVLRQSSSIFARFGVGASDRTRIAASESTPASEWTDLLATGGITPSGKT